MSDGSGERSLGERMKTIAVDDRRPVETGPNVVESNLRGQSTDRSGYFRHGDEFPDVDHLRSREHEYGSTLSTNVGQPQLTAFQVSPHVSASLQNVSARSGRLR